MADIDCVAREDDLSLLLPLPPEDERLSGKLAESFNVRKGIVLSDLASLEGEVEGTNAWESSPFACGRIALGGNDTPSPLCFSEVEVELDMRCASQVLFLCSNRSAFATGGVDANWHFPSARVPLGDCILDRP
tara:strand:- start:51 stop:449 length:399 start_codon:yes stop_codon:yes gene_type:complete